MHGLLIIMKKK